MRQWWQHHHHCRCARQPNNRVHAVEAHGCRDARPCVTASTTSSSASGCGRTTERAGACHLSRTRPSVVTCLCTTIKFTENPTRTHWMKHCRNEDKIPKIFNTKFPRFSIFNSATARPQPHLQRFLPNYRPEIQRSHNP